MTKTISVLLTVYNGSAYLRQTLDSIANQSFARQRSAEFEVIIADDASTDDSIACITEWKARQDFDVTVIEQPFNKGVWANLNAAYAVARGAYIAQISHDDIWHTDHLAALLSALETDLTASVSFSTVDYINGGGKPVAGYHFRHEALEEYSHPSLLTELVKRNLFCGSAALIRRACFSSRYWGVSNEMLQDYEAWMELALQGHFLYVPAPLSGVSYRLHQTNLSGGMIASVQHNYERLSAINRVFLSERFLTFYRSLDDDARLDFLYALDEAFTILSTRLDGASFTHAQLLERLWFVEDVHQAGLNALRAAMALKLGMGRKYHQLRKIAEPDAIPQSALPILTPYDRTALPFLDRLAAAGVGKMGQAEPAGFLLIAAKDWENCREEAAVAQAAQDKRILLFDGENEGRIESGYRFATDTLLSDKELTAFWRFVEEEGILRPSHQSPHRMDGTLLVLRNVYKRTGHFIPKRFRCSLVRLAHRLLDRKG